MQIRVKEAAKILGVTIDTVRDWADKGKISCIRQALSNDRIFDSDELKTLARRLQKKRAPGLSVFKEKDRRYKKNEE